MPSRLSSRKSSATFETDDSVFDKGSNRQIIITLKPKVMELRLKGRRKMEPVVVNYAAIFMKVALAAFK